MFFVALDATLSPRDGLQWRVSRKKKLHSFSPTGESYRLLHSGILIGPRFSMSIVVICGGFVRSEVDRAVYD